jgi:hypothetical protein
MTINLSFSSPACPLAGFKSLSEALPENSVCGVGVDPLVPTGEEANEVLGKERQFGVDGF